MKKVYNTGRDYFYVRCRKCPRTKEVSNTHALAVMIVGIDKKLRGIKD
jgi:hypothetical protein